MMKASDIMTTEVVAIPGSVTVATAVKIMKEKGVHNLIIERRHSQDAYGILTQTDVIEKVIAFGKDPKQVRVYEVMAKPCIVVNPDLGVEYVARLFTNTNIHSAPVIKDTLLGIITITDILEKSDFIESPKALLLEKEIEEAIAKARKISQEQGYTQECINAWYHVEELQAEAAHQQGQKPEKTALEEYFEEYPEAIESLDLDNWCSG
jgi:CBS domain-containing protein